MRLLLSPPEPPAVLTPSQHPDETPEKTTKDKRKRKKEKERDRSKLENKEEQGTTQGKGVEEKDQKTQLPTQPGTGDHSASLSGLNRHFR